MHTDKPLIENIRYDTGTNIWTLATNSPERYEVCAKCKKPFNQMESKKMYCPAFKICYCEKCEPTHMMPGETEHTHFNLGNIEATEDGSR